MKTPADVLRSRSRSKSDETYVFVYGSLLRGEPNHRQIARGRYLGAFTTRPQFRLLDLGAFPAMVNRGTTAVVGELYAVAPDLLAALDRFEGHPRFYVRQRVELRPRMVADAYLLATDATRSPEISSGDWRAHRASRR